VESRNPQAGRAQRRTGNRYLRLDRLLQEVALFGGLEISPPDDQHASTFHFVNRDGARVAGAAR
jgi:hypothetical protein